MQITGIKDILNIYLVCIYTKLHFIDDIIIVIILFFHYERGL